jgi:hypothetical protein
MKKFIKELIFGRVRRPVDTISTGLHTVYPKDELSFQGWLNQYRVSMLSERKPIFINNPKTKKNGTRKMDQRDN